MVALRQKPAPDGVFGAQSPVAPDAQPVAGAYSGGLQSGPPAATIAPTLNEIGQPNAPPAPDINIEQKGPAEQLYDQHGQDFFQQGPGQQFFAQHGNDFLQPSQSEQLWNQQQAAGPLSNNAQTEYDAFGSRRPNISAEPGFGSYYDNAVKNTTNTLNTELGARGAYGSSVGLGQIGKSVTDLRADQARNEADYNLKRLAEQRNWNTLGGTLARNADISGESNADTMGTLAKNAGDAHLAGLRGAGDAAQNAGTEFTQNHIAGFNAGANAQSAHEGRAQQVMDNVRTNEGVMQSMYAELYNALINGDLSLDDASMAARVGQSREAVNAGSAQGNTLSDAVQAYAKLKALKK